MSELVEDEANLNLSALNFVAQYIDIPELDELYNRDDEPAIAEILISLGFSSFIEIFKDEQIDYEAFQNLSENTIVNLLKSYRKGVIVKFLMKHKQWKESIKIENSTGSETATSSKKIKPGIVLEILNSSSEGKQFLANVNSTVAFSTDTQKKLRHILIGYFLDSQVTLVKKEIEALSQEIASTFPNEDASAYFNSTTKHGPLYIDHNNRVQMMRKLNILPQSDIKKTKKRGHLEMETSSEENQKYEASEVELLSDEMVKVGAGSMELQTFMQHWKSSSKLRLQKIKALKPGMQITSILTEYQAYKRGDGSALIEIDFLTLHPQSKNPTDVAWSAALVKLIEILQSEIKNDVAKAQIQDMSSEEISFNQRSVLVIVALHAALYSRKQVQPATKLWRVNLPDAYKFLILHCKTENALDIEIEKRRNLLNQNKATLQPVIAVFGDSLSSVIDKFCIVFEDIKYYSTSFIKALGVLLKIYELFDLAFPGPSANVLHFLSKFLLDVHLSGADSKVLNLVKNIKSNL